jgi:hypothetical protein
MKNKLIGLLVCLLIIGISTTSAISISNKSKKDVSNEDCDCNEISEELSNIIVKDKEIYVGRPICEILYSIFSKLQDSLITLWGVQNKLEQFDILYNIMESITGIVLLKYSVIGDMAKLFICDWVDW